MHHGHHGGHHGSPILAAAVINKKKKQAHAQAQAAHTQTHTQTHAQTPSAQACAPPTQAHPPPAQAQAPAQAYASPPAQAQAPPAQAYAPPPTQAYAPPPQAYAPPPAKPGLPQSIPEFGDVVTLQTKAKGHFLTSNDNHELKGEKEAKGRYSKWLITPVSPQEPSTVCVRDHSKRFLCMTKDGDIKTTSKIKKEIGFILEKGDNNLVCLRSHGYYICIGPLVGKVKTKKAKEKDCVFKMHVISSTPPPANHGVPPQGAHPPAGYAPAQPGYAPNPYAPAQPGYPPGQPGYAPNPYAPAQPGYPPAPY